MSTTSPSSIEIFPDLPATRSPNASSPPAAACLSSCSPADRLDDKASGFEPRPMITSRSRSNSRTRARSERSTAGRAHNRPPVREIAGLRGSVPPEVYRDDRYVALTRKQFAVLEVLVAAEGGVVSAEELLSESGMRTQTCSPTPRASRSPNSANASANPGSSPRWPASATNRREARHRTRGRRPWIEPLVSAFASSYPQLRRLPHAGRFLMSRRPWWFAGQPGQSFDFLLRYLLDDADQHARSRSPREQLLPLLRAFAPRGHALAFLLVFGLLGGWLLAGRMLAPDCITDATRTAANGSLSTSNPARRPQRRFRELADAFDAMLARLEAHVAEQQRFAANASTNCAPR